MKKKKTLDDLMQLHWFLLGMSEGIALLRAILQLVYIGKKCKLSCVVLYRLNKWDAISKKLFRERPS